MKRTILSAILLIIAASTVGCGETIIPCTSDTECTFDLGWDSARSSWGSYSMVCNMDVSPVTKCNELMGDMPDDWLTVPPMVLCAMIFGDVADHGTCESSEASL
jgi:hypothetical protein